ncbi:MAG: nucleotidyltransferase family protein [Acidobacteria bacterium]|nr:nucleotidyltransferase family protein [Acidobacteriota bacterium]
MRHAFQAFGEVLAALDKLEIKYAVGGSVASSMHGIARFTGDVDILVDMHPTQVTDFLDALGDGFAADADHIRNAFRISRPANLIHIESVYKFDLFPVSGNRFRLAEIQRSTMRESNLFGESIEFAVVSAEDAILAKLDWIRQSGGGSDKQLNDILGIIAIQDDKLDRAYMSTTAAELGLTAELNRLFD